MFRKTLILAAPVLATAVSALIAAPAAAQQASASPVIDTIIVTAQKREQSLKDVPISIVALNADQLETQQINDVRDLATNVPNLFINNFNARSDVVRLFIRGLGQNDVSVTQDPSVALYVDGVYVGSSVGAGFESVDLERVEVLRGPQGTLYGRNATGGAVNLISQKPQLGEFRIKGEATTGNYNFFNGKANINIPLGEIAALKIGGVTTDRDGWVKNTGIGKDFGEQDRTAARAALRIQPSSNFTIDYGFDYSHNQDTQTATIPSAGAPIAFPVGAPFPIDGVGNVIPTLRFDYTDPVPFRDHRPDKVRSARNILPSDDKVTGHNLTLNWDVTDHFTLRSISSYRAVDSYQYADNLPTFTYGVYLVAIDGPFAGADIATIGGPDAIAENNDYTTYNTYSQEIQAIGDATIGNSKLNYVAGLYFYKDDSEQNSIAFSIGGPRGQAFTSTENKSYAAFGEVTLTPGFNEALHFTLGGRFSKDKRKAFRINESSFSYAALGGFTPTDCVVFAAVFTEQGTTCDGLGVTAGADYDNSFNKFNPSGTVAWDITDNMNLYGKISTGYKSGGTSQRSANPDYFAEGFEPEKVQSYEVGFKGEFLDRRLSLNAAVFYMKLDAYQSSVQTGATAGDRDFRGIDGNKIKGFEADLTAAITENLTATLGVGLLDTEFGIRSQDIVLDTGEPTTILYTKRFSYAPDESFSVSLDYNRPVTENFSFGARVGYAYQSDMETSSNVTDNRPLDAKGLLDASITLTRMNVGDGEFKVRLWGKNLTDEEYKTVSFGSFAQVGAFTSTEYGEPRTYGVTLGFDF